VYQSRVTETTNVREQQERHIRPALEEARVSVPTDFFPRESPYEDSAVVQRDSKRSADSDGVL
jgi:hypothetical protein